VGGGTKFTADVPKGKPFDLLAAIAEAGNPGASGSVAQAAEFCAQTHAVPFRAAAGARLTVGTQTRLILADPPRVMSADEEIGTVEGAIATAMRGCLTLGYEMTGTVTSFDEQLGSGVLAIAGARRQVA
jgi:hypothetical protein